MKISMRNKGIAVILILSICFAMVGCGKEKDFDQKANAETIVMTVAEEDVTLEQYYLYLVQYIFNNSTNAANITEENMSTVFDATTEQIKVEMIQYKLATVTEGVVVTDEDINNGQKIADRFYSYFGEEFMNKFGISKEAIDEMFRKQTYVEALKNKSMKDLTNDYKTQFDEQYKDVDCFTLYYALFPSVKYDAEGNPVATADGTYETCSAEEMQEKLDLANEYLEKVKENVANGEADGNMEGLAIEYGIDKFSGIEHNFVGSYTKELNKLIDEMDNGDISEVVETPAGYMIVRMDNKNDSDFKEFSIEYMSEQSAQSLFSTLQSNWLSASGEQFTKADTSMITYDKLIKIISEMNEKGYSITGDN